MKLDTLLSYSSGDINFVKDTVQLFIRESGNTLNDLTSACKSRDWKTVHRLSHSLKPNYETFELYQLKSLAYDIEQASKDYRGEGRDLQRKVQQLSDQTKQVYPLLKQELNRLS
ncbi:MAG: Hpt domain-containing protein [Bacteroidota bacterium]